MNKRSMLLVGVVGVGFAAVAFEKVSLIDSLDAARTWDVETPEGMLKVLDDAMRPHSTRVLWRDKGACLMRYPCAEGPRELVAIGLFASALYPEGRTPQLLDSRHQLAADVSSCDTPTFRRGRTYFDRDPHEGRYLPFRG